MKYPKPTPKTLALLFIWQPFDPETPWPSSGTGAALERWYNVHQFWSHDYSHYTRSLLLSKPSLQSTPVAESLLEMDRAQGRIPAVVFALSQFDKNPSSESISRKQLLNIERKQIQSILKSIELPFFCSTTFQLQIRAGSGSSVLLDSRRVLPIKARQDFTANSIEFCWPLEIMR
ncbi:hypothetical protein GH714_031990 [Hevea brasiliensis]|uniref:Uncharacterized protein n=1 Tax=Hevea brasiliensis TaxID=3981 RepID=A0A6A6L6B2_HEVBR|nr:hypothetical protein GH714_031990 [Hevea brasiliensis]